MKLEQENINYKLKVDNLKSIIKNLDYLLNWFSWFSKGEFNFSIDLINSTLFILRFRIGIYIDDLNWML
jgi:hypothetical protein